MWETLKNYLKLEHSENCTNLREKFIVRGYNYQDMEMVTSNVDRIIIGGKFIACLLFDGQINK